MDFIPSMAAVAAASQKSPHIDATAIALSSGVGPTEPAALDPRSSMTLAPGTADAMLSLAVPRTQALDASDFDTRYRQVEPLTAVATAAASAPVISPEPTKATSAANRNWIEDARLDPVAARKVGTDTLVEYDTPRVTAPWSTAFPDTPERPFRGLTPVDANAEADKRKVLTDGASAIMADEIYLLCNDKNYKNFSETYPHTRVVWIEVDNDEILVLWPKDEDREGQAASAGRVRGSAAADRT